MGKAPWGCTPGWDVPRDYFDPDPPDANEESFDQMCEERMDIQDALDADGEKLRQLTGQEHGPMCPRCLVNPLDRALLGSDQEGHICGTCWSEDRSRDEAVKVGQRVAAKMDTLAYMAGDKFGRIERIEGPIIYVRMERSGGLTPFRADQLVPVRERAALPPHEYEAKK